MPSESPLRKKNFPWLYTGESHITFRGTSVDGYYPVLSAAQIDLIGANRSFRDISVSNTHVGLSAHRAYVFQFPEP